MSPMLRRPVLLVTILAIALGVLAGCSDDRDEAEPTSTTANVPSTAVPASTSAAPASTTRPPDRCAEPPGPIAGSPLATPDDANRECDLDAGWRFLFWIGESGDPIYRVQRLDGDAWVDEGYDVACGLDATTLDALGVPAQPAATWVDKYGDQC
jgi:hypothetical protein